jgi:hypothetical protein
MSFAVYGPTEPSRQLLGTGARSTTVTGSWRLLQCECGAAVTIVADQFLQAFVSFNRRLATPAGLASGTFDVK